MSPGAWPEAADLPAQRDRLAADVARLSQRLRGLGLPRLAQDLHPYGTRGDAGHRAAQVLADLAHGVEDRNDPSAPRWREVPRLSDASIGDQVAVTGHDAVAAVAGTPPEAEVWTRAGRSPVSEAVADALAELRTLRLAID
ncbi:MAG: hypothetical protein ACRDYU_12540 [Actinomycetes bacterium]